MSKEKTTETQQGIPSVSWAWFHSGAIDLLVCAVLVGIGLYSLLHTVMNPRESTIKFIIVIATGFILQKVFDVKVQQKLFLRIPKTNAKLSKMELISEVAVIVLLLAPVLLARLLNFDGLTLLGIASLLALLIGCINSIRVKYNFFLLIALFYCVLLMRSFLGDSFTTILPASQAWVRYILAGLLFGAVSISRLVSFFKKYPVIKE